MKYYYYDLINDNVLPPGAKFKDPYDHSIFLAKPKESLSKFINLIQNSRELKNLPLFNESDLRKYVVESFLKTTPKNLYDKYFVRKKEAVTSGQAATFIKTAVREIFEDDYVSISQQRKRAGYCKGCIFNKKGTSWAKSAQKIVSTITNVVTNTVSVKDELNYPEREHLGVCDMCGCGLKDKIRYNISNVLVDTNPAQLDKIISTYQEEAFDTCWILNECLQNGAHKRVLREKLANGRLKGDKLLTTYINNKVRKAKK